MSNATPVITECALPDKCSNIWRASDSSCGFPNTLLSRTTIVSAPNTILPSGTPTAQRALPNAWAFTISIGLS